MLRNFLRKFSFLMVSLLLVSCASQKSITPLNTADVNPELNSGQTTQKVKPVKETGSAIEQTPASKAEPVPENVFITLNV